MGPDSLASPAETRLGSIFGTARYMSPEQVLGEAVDRRTDIWSLGAVLYEMVAGQAPFSGETTGEVMTSILETEPPPFTNHNAQIPAELEQIIKRTLRKERNERYRNARELLDALKGVRRRMDLSAESKSLIASSTKRHWTRSPAAVVLAMLIGCSGVGDPVLLASKSNDLDAGEKHRRAAFREPERRQGKRLLRGRDSG